MLSREGKELAKSRIQQDTQDTRFPIGNVLASFVLPQIS
jgi:hypothetical protein